LLFWQQSFFQHGYRKNQNRPPPSKNAPVRITNGCLPPKQLLNDSKSHLKVSVVSSWRSACPNDTFFRLLLHSTNIASGIFLLLVLWVVSKVITSLKSTYSARWLALLQKKCFLALLSLGQNQHPSRMLHCSAYTP
jgi:hypothetical protein